VNEPYKTYDFSLEGRDWNLITAKFLSYCFLGVKSL
jgi:hypothetical protein